MVVSRCDRAIVPLTQALRACRPHRNYADGEESGTMQLKKLTLRDLGWTSFFENHFLELRQPALAPARVVEELRGFYRVRSQQREHLAEIPGRFRSQAQERVDLPAVGDWVGIAVGPEDNRARIECILPRKTKLSRKIAGGGRGEQIVATNIDTVFVVSSLNRELNLRRLERYLTVVWESGAEPVVLLSTADLCADPVARMADVERIAMGVPVHLLSAIARTGFEVIWEHLTHGITGVFVGSSGVGKSTLINVLSGTESLRVRPVREEDDRGRHTTSSRQMIFLPGGGIVIDTPGMRELSPCDGKEGLDQAFEDIRNLARSCKFRDCNHEGEPECLVQAAIQSGGLESERLTNFLKLQAELRYQERKVDPQVAREVKKEWKRIHKVIRRDKTESLPDA